jgi:heptosyltransferase-2
MREPRKILVRAPNWTGDVIMATPGLRALRTAHPTARLSVHVRPGLEPLLAGAPWVDEIRPVVSYHRGTRALLREARALRRERFDLGLCLPDSFSSALLMRAGGVRHVIGYRRGLRSALLHEAVSTPPGTGRRLLIARERHVLGLVAAAGVPPCGTHLELFVTPAEEAARREALRAAGADPDAPGPWALLAPGASYGPSKLWPAASFAATGDALAAAGARVAVIGTPAERALTARVAAAMRAPAVDLGGRLGLGGLKALIRSARVLVCNDAGARHVAVAFGVPTVCIMGPTALEKTDLNLEHVRVLAADVACRPCYARTCPIDHRCMTRVPAGRVAEAALEALASEPGRFRGGSLVLAGEAAEPRRSAA